MINNSYPLVLKFRELPIFTNSSLPRRRESRDVKRFWIPAFAGMTFSEVAFKLKILDFYHSPPR
jgi:hypothetical protein